MRGSEGFALHLPKYSARITLGISIRVRSRSRIRSRTRIRVRIRSRVAILQAACIVRWLTVSPSVAFDSLQLLKEQRRLDGSVEEGETAGRSPPRVGILRVMPIRRPFSDPLM